MKWYKNHNLCYFNQCFHFIQLLFIIFCTNESTNVTMLFCHTSTKIPQK